MNFKSTSNWGDHLGSQLKGPEWTPYAQAIADGYPVQIPWFCTLPSNLVEGVTFQDRKTVLTPPQQHDVLIFGAYATVSGPDVDDDGNFILLQITDEETGIPWVVPNVVGAAPLPTIAGSVHRAAAAINLTTVLRLPEAFFLRRHNRLKLDWSQSILDANRSYDALITLVGVRLVGAAPPKEIAMPDGSVIAPGARLPWFMTLALGDKLRFEEWIDWEIDPFVEYLQFSSPQDCAVEIHDAYYNRRRIPELGLMRTKLQIMGRPNSWTPQKPPLAAWTGDEAQVNPTLPFTKPFLLNPQHRIALIEQNLNFFSIWSMVTFRGVRLCGF